MIESFGLVSVLSPFNKEGVYVIPKPGDYVGTDYIFITCCHPSMKRVCTCPKPGDHAVSVSILYPFPTLGNPMPCRKCELTFGCSVGLLKIANGRGWSITSYDDESPI
ncbi:hypothetical protein HanXRQr2_Chr05g0206851 [Helianthus annuus]|uniref:Uncharacterized protein n=1 Tax=Helianthus annuus TaxID=4232 RepID=A0A9K3NLY1_HELAN|nr:hypothetical protein HanXRQr2_Chr05g0206851 [Helianthus annuus]